eukprot:TRINITY_DN7262_c1_g1_i1.p1 TRINITY_DN7262_c1_g1~~TRINITY_DN7262_c1_g1_i1.p1  ORF type:complete len:1150 (+),score=282.11 TRINITY_DN7262_c1_g1_i1:94-3543(+)
MDEAGSPTEAAAPARRRLSRRRKRSPRRVRDRPGQAGSVVAAVLRRQQEMLSAASEGKPPDVGHVEKFAQVAGAAALQCCQRSNLVREAKTVLDALSDLIDSSSSVGKSLPPHVRSRFEATVCSNYAVFYKHTGQWDDALRQCTRALHRFRTLPDPPPGDVAAAGLNMAAILGRLGKHRGAVRHAAAAVDLIESSGNSDSLAQMLAVALYNLAVELQHCKDWLGARDAIIRAHRVARKALPQSDPTAIAIVSLLRSNTRRKLKTMASVVAPQSKAGSDDDEQEAQPPEKDAVVEAPAVMDAILITQPTQGPGRTMLQGWGDDDGESGSPMSERTGRGSLGRVPSFLPPGSMPGSPLGRALTPLPALSSPKFAASSSALSRPRPPPQPLTARAPRPLPGNELRPSDLPKAASDASENPQLPTTPVPTAHAAAPQSFAPSTFGMPSSFDSGAPQRSNVGAQGAMSPQGMGAWEVQQGSPPFSAILAPLATEVVSEQDAVTVQPTSKQSRMHTPAPPGTRATSPQSSLAPPLTGGLDRPVVNLLYRSVHGDRVSKKAGRAGTGFHNIAMSQRAHAQHFKKCQKHLASVTHALGVQRRKKVAAALTIQCAYRSACARIELYNRRQLLYQYIFDKQTFVANLIKGRIRSWRMQRWLQGQRSEAAARARLRAEREEVEDTACCVLQRSWRVCRARRELRARKAVFEQALAETRMRRLAQVVVGVQRWWRWVRLRKRYWRRRAMEVARAQTEIRVSDQQNRAARRVQAVWRGVLGRMFAAADRERVRKEVEKRRQQLPHAASVVHFVLRSVALRMRRARLREAALLREAQERPPAAACTIQRGWRSHRARSESTARRHTRDTVFAAACAIQRMVRSYRARVLARRKRWVGRTLLVSLQAEEARQEAACIRIQTQQRRVAARRRVTHMRAEIGRAILVAAAKMQVWSRQCLAKRELQRRRSARQLQRLHAASENEAACHLAACRIQCGWLRLRGRRRHRAAIADLEECRELAKVLAKEEAVYRRYTEALQCAGRGLLGRRKLLQATVRRRAAATIIQCAARCSAARQNRRNRAQRLVEQRVRNELYEEVRYELHNEYNAVLLGVEQEERREEEDEEEIARRRLAVRALAAGLAVGSGGLLPPPSPLSSSSDDSGCYD